jgi:hypothetical protein
VKNLNHITKKYATTINSVYELRGMLIELLNLKVIDTVPHDLPTGNTNLL